MTSKLLRGLYFAMPADLRQASLVRRRSKAWRKAGIVFIHVPKAAGTSISQALYGEFLGHVRARDIAKWASSDVKSLPRFAITRNPWDRIVSAFRYGRRLHRVDWQADHSVPTNVRYQVPEIEHFSSFITEWLANQDLTKLNPIYQPQSLFLCDDRGQLLVDHAGRVETLAATEEFIRDHLGFRPLIAETNPSGGRVDWRSFYTPELAGIVGRLYAPDVERFGYAFE